MPHFFCGAFFFVYVYLLKLTEMKKIYQSLIGVIVLLLVCTQSMAQTTITINSGAALTTDTHSGPIYRSSAGSSYAFSQFAYVYTPTDLATVPSGSTISKLAWNKTSAFATVAANATFRIYMKNSSTTSYTAAATFSSLTTGASLVYTNTTQAIPATTGFLDFVLTTPFVYTGGSIEIMTDWDISAAGANPTTGVFTWEKTTVASSILGYANSTAFTTALSTTSNSIGTLTNSRPTLQLTYTGGAACSGTPTAGTAASSASPVCAGSSFILSVTGATSGVSGLTYQWQSSPDGTTWTDISGATFATLSTTQTVNTNYRRRITCSGNNVFSSGVLVSMIPVTYVTLPFSESFEPTWIDGCGAAGSKSIPNSSWRNNPTSGNNSWRRNDEAIANSGWTSITGSYTPSSSAGSFSARFHSYDAANATTGGLDVYVNCSGSGANKTLSFDYINVDGADSVSVQMSTNGGTTFTRLDSITLRAAWTNKSLSFTSTSATTVIRFLAYSDYGNSDIGIDNIAILPPSSLDISAISIVSPASAITPTSTATLTVRIQNVGTSTLNFATNNVTVGARVTNPSATVAPFTTVVNTGTLAAGSTQDVVVTNALNMSAVGNYVIKGGATVVGDGSTSNDSTSNFISFAGPVKVAVATGNWNAGATWSGGTVPTSSDSCIIPNGFTVTVNTINAQASNINISSGGKLIVATGADIEVGPYTSERGGNKLLLNNGSLEITGGLIKVAGYVNTLGAGSDFKMSGGELKIDGDGSINKVSGTQIIFRLGNATNISTSTVTGGKITIVDPNPISTTTKVFQYDNPGGTGNDASWVGNTVQFGEPGLNTSTSTNNFVVDLWTSTGFLQLGDAIINTGGGTTGRSLISSYQFSVGGVLTVRANSNFAPGTSAVAVTGNVIVEAGATVTAVSLIKGGFVGQNSGATLLAVQSNIPSSILDNGTIRETSASTCTNCLVSLTVNATNAAPVTLSSPIVVATGTLTLQSGVLNTTATNLLTVGLSTTTVGTIAAGTGQVVGPIKKFMAAATGNTILPVGTATFARPATLNFTAAPATAGSVTAQFISTNPGNGGLPLTDGVDQINTISTAGFWRIDAGDGLAGGTYSIALKAAGIAGINTPTDLRVVKRPSNGTNWTVDGTHAAGGTDSTANRTGCTGFSEFAIAGRLATNPLPVILVDFRGVKQGNTNNLTWTTTTEQNNSGFELQRSADGTNFSSLGFVSSKAINGNSVTSLNYDFKDAKPFAGNNYYRLKQLDKDGKATVSQIVLLKGKATELSISSVYPNPVSNVLNLIVATPATERITIVVSDITGKILSQKQVQLATGDNNVQVDVSKLAAGTYMIRAICENGCNSGAEKFVKQ
jgi:Secretion system C-terminal sorting domain